MDDGIGTERISTLLHIQLINGRSRIQILDSVIPKITCSLTRHGTVSQRV